MKKNIRATTIAAISTPPGRGGVGIVRVSGPLSHAIAEQVLGMALKPRHATYARFLDKNNQTLDQGIGIFFQAPHSFTGEDVLELQGHGGTAVLHLLLNRVLELGAEPAKPGEFTERAFINEKMDLSQAEAIADLINASTEQSARSAMRSLDGEFSTRVSQLQADMLALRIYVEAAIDFPDEEIDFLKEGQVSEKITQLHAIGESLLKNARAGALLNTGMTVVIAGAPNVGKSSIMNLLSAQDVSIVTDIPGTTRDMIKQTIHLDGVPLHMVDTAGLRACEEIVERIGIDRAVKAIKEADKLLWMIDASTLQERALSECWPDGMGEMPDPKNTLIVFNKIDVLTQAPAVGTIEGYPCVYVSVKTEQGIDLLKQQLLLSMGFDSLCASPYSARERHILALENAQRFIQQALLQLKHGAGELVAEELRGAHDALGEVFGKMSSDELLGQIFSQFCIGK